MAQTKETAAKVPKGWSESGDRLRAGYKFRDFQGAMSFLVEVGFQAEVSEHHPDFAVHYNEVRFEVWSHDAGKVTERDRKLVSAIAKIAERHNAKTV